MSDPRYPGDPTRDGIRRFLAMATTPEIRKQITEQVIAVGTNSDGWFGFSSWTDWCEQAIDTMGEMSDRGSPYSPPPGKGQ